MRRLLWVLWVALLVSACTKEKAGAPPEGGLGAPGTSEGERGLEPLAEPEPGTYRLTEAKLAAYVGYQRQLLEAYEALLRDMARVQGQLESGAKAAGPAELGEAMKLIESKAKAEEQARHKAGLTEVDVNAIAELVTAVISQRQLNQALQFDEELKKLEELQAKLRPEQREELAPQVAAMRERLEALGQLAEVRARYGDANVDLVLTREEELTKNYQDMLGTFSRR